MGITQTNYTLPEWVFLDANSHQGNPLEGRTVIQHIRSYTIIEVLALDEFITSHFKTKLYSFNYTNFAGITEKHAMAVHFSLAENEDLADTIKKAIAWYTEYLTWEDKNIQDDGTGFHN